MEIPKEASPGKQEEIQAEIVQQKPTTDSTEDTKEPKQQVTLSIPQEEEECVIPPRPQVEATPEEACKPSEEETKASSRPGEKKRQAPKVPSKEEVNLAPEASPMTKRHIRKIQDKPVTRQPKTGWL